MKKEYYEPEFDVTKLKFETVLGNFYSDPGDQGSAGDDPNGDPFA